MLVVCMPHLAHGRSWASSLCSEAGRAFFPANLLLHLSCLPAWCRGFGWSEKPLVDYRGYNLWPEQIADFVREVRGTKVARPFALAFWDGLVPQRAGARGLHLPIFPRIFSHAAS